MRMRDAFGKDGHVVLGLSEEAVKVCVECAEWAKVRDTLRPQPTTVKVTDTDGDVCEYREAAGDGDVTLEGFPGVSDVPGSGKCHAIRKCESAVHVSHAREDELNPCVAIRACG